LFFKEIMPYVLSHLGNRDPALSQSVNPMDCGGKRLNKRLL